MLDSLSIIGVIQNHRLTMTRKACAVSRRYTCRLDATQPTPTANRPTNSMYTGSRRIIGLMDFCHTATVMIASATAIRWWIMDERKIDTATTSDGNTVRVIRLDCSTSDPAERVTVS